MLKPQSYTLSICVTVQLRLLPCTRGNNLHLPERGLKPEVPCFQCSNQSAHIPATLLLEIGIYFFSQGIENLKTNYATMNLWLKVGWDHYMAEGATHHIHGGNKLQSPSGSAAHKAESAVPQLCSWQQPRSCQSVEKWLSLHRNDWFIHPIRRESNVPGERQAQLSMCWSFCCIWSWM